MAGPSHPAYLGHVNKSRKNLSLMKWNYKSSLAAIAGLAILLPMAAFGEDQKPDDKKFDKHAGKGQPQQQQHGAKAVQQAQTVATNPAAGKSRAKNFQNNAASTSVPRVQNKTVRTEGPSTSLANKRAIAKQQSTVQQAPAQTVQSNRRGYNGPTTQTRVLASQQTTYTRSNNYGGLWFAGNTHGDWNHNGDHYYNNHHYRWYQGGWLIIDGGYQPFGNNGYSGGGSTVSNVQASLADAGYYHGPIDGDLGPGTRNAIAGYQSDYGLRVTGRINDPLLQSLQLE